MCRKLKIYIIIIIYILLYYYIGILFFFSAVERGLNDLMTNDLMTCVERNVLIINTLAYSLGKCPTKASGGSSRDPRSEKFRKILRKHCMIFLFISRKVVLSFAILGNSVADLR